MFQLGTDVARKRAGRVACPALVNILNQHIEFSINIGLQVVVFLLIHPPKYKEKGTSIEKRPKAGTLSVFSIHLQKREQ